MGDNPRFQDHPLKTGGVVFTRICNGGTDWRTAFAIPYYDSSDITM